MNGDSVRWTHANDRKEVDPCHHFVAMPLENKADPPLMHIDRSNYLRISSPRAPRCCGCRSVKTHSRFPSWASMSAVVIYIVFISTLEVCATIGTRAQGRTSHLDQHHHHQQVPISKHHNISTRSLRNTKQQLNSLQFNHSSVEPISLEIEPNPNVGSSTTPGACPPQAQQQPDNYYKSLGYTQPQVSNFVRPQFYTLRLKVDPTKRKFTAQLMITLEILASPAAANGNDGESQADDQEQLSGSHHQQQQQTNGHRYLTLHSGSNIHVKRAFYVYTTRGSIQIPASKIGRDARNELLTIDFHPNVITAGQGLLLIVYSGLVNETESHGLFVHHSLKPNKRIPAVLLSPLGPTISGGNKTTATTMNDDYGLATHMQPSFARRLFPSWDEPHLKARFSLIVVLPFRGYQSLSNMPVNRKSFSLSCSGEPMQEIEFHTTPIMSTYLLTLVIGRFDYLESITPNNCRVRVYVYANLHNLANNNELASNSEQKQQQQNPINPKRQAASLALTVAVKTIDRLETLLGVKYPLSKFDMIALRDFNSGGMENWGAALFHENYLLYEPVQSGANGAASTDIQVNGGKSRPRWMVVPLVVAHEIAHQWFGNLISPQSWTYLWLNEGFAQLLMYDLADHLSPEHNYLHMFIEDSRQSALHDDELLTSSHALEPEVYSTRPLDAENGSSPGAVDQLSLFDEITYNKGALVVRTVYFLLGREQFFAGLKHYLLKHSYDNVRSHDLWSALEEANGLPDGQLESLMQCWLNQEGYPLISVTILEEPNHWRLRLSQSRFTLLQLDEVLPLNRSLEAEGDSAKPARGTAAEPPEPIWVLPVAVSSELNPSPHASELNLASLRRSTAGHFLLVDRTATLLLPKSSTGSWFKLNFNATGHHRVDYQLRLNRDGSLGQQGNQLRNTNQVDMLARMVPAIRDKSMCVIDRLNLVDDLFAMVRSGKKPTAYYLRYIQQAYEEETEMIVLRSIVDSLKRIKAIVSNGGQRLNSLYDRYVQKYLRKVSLSLGRHKVAATAALANSTVGSPHIGPLGTTSAVVDINQPQQRLKQNINQLKEIEALIESSRIQFNDTEFHQRAALLFNRNFRQQPIPSTSATSSSSSSATTGNLFDSMDKEMWASIYSGALMMGSSSRAADLAPNSLPFRIDGALPGSSGRNHNVTATGGVNNAANNATSDPIVGSHSRISSIFADQEVALDNNSSGPPDSQASRPTSDRQDNVFDILLKAYETSESSSERFAICSALGHIDEPGKLQKLLNLTLFDNYFRQQDSYHLLESIARSKQGRQLIWDQFKSNIKTIERRQLLTSVLKSLSHGGLIEQQSPFGDGKIETQLRNLYQTYSNEYGKVLSITTELLLINSKWFIRDHDGLVQFLESSSASSASGV